MGKVGASRPTFVRIYPCQDVGGETHRKVDWEIGLLSADMSVEPMKKEDASY